MLTFNWQNIDKNTKLFFSRGYHHINVQIESGTSPPCRGSSSYGFILNQSDRRIFVSSTRTPSFWRPMKGCRLSRAINWAARINRAPLTPSLIIFNLRSVGFCFFQSLILRSARFLIDRFRLVTKSRGISLNKVQTYFHDIFVNILVLKILCEKVKNKKVFFFILLSK